MQFRREAPNCSLSVKCMRDYYEFGVPASCARAHAQLKTHGQSRRWCFTVNHPDGCQMDSKGCVVWIAELI